jgi:DNA-binding NarL/FixJ family response regulator
MESTVIRVAIVDDHPVARWGIEHLFESCDHIQVVSSVSAVEELDAAPQVVILDLYLRAGRPALAAIEALASCCRVLVMSASGRLDDVLAAIRAGASGYLTKDASEEAFVSGVQQVAAGGFYLSSRLADMLQADLARVDDQEPQLARREQETLRYIAHGFTHAQTARRMGVSPATVDTYVKRIRTKLGLGNKADLTRRAIELHRREPPSGA